MAENYKVGRFAWPVGGLTLCIQNPLHSQREGKSKAGKSWQCLMAAHYGYIEGTKGADGDAVDCFIGTDVLSERVFVVNQAFGGKFDEHKVMLCFANPEVARSAYMRSYMRDWQGFGGMVECSIPQLRWWLKYGDVSKPLDPAKLPHERAQMKTTHWTSDALPLGASVDEVLTGIRVDDGADGLLLDSATMAELLADPDVTAVLSMDALVTPFSMLERKMSVMRGVMDRTGGSVKTASMQLSDPFKQRGTVNVAVLYELDDGQTITALFHNPDSTPAKLAPTDDLISWKWMLNKKDVTIVVAPERGQDLNVREVARRLMRLAEKNSESFKKANAKRAERMAAIDGLKQEIAGLEDQLSKAEKELELARLEAEQRNAQKSRQAAEDAAYLPDGWTESRPGGMATKAGPDGGIVDYNIKSGKWFVTFNSDALEGTDAIFATRKEALQHALREISQRIDVTTEQGYYKVWGGGGNQKLAEAFQDQLDHMFQGRIIEVRNALRDLGWQGERFGDLTKNGAHLILDLWQVGAGKNIAGVVYKVDGNNVKAGGQDGVRDNLGVTPKELAAEIDFFVKAVPEKTPIDYLVEQHGWNRQSTNVADKDFAGVASAGDLSEGTRTWFANYKEEGQRRSLTLQAGFDDLHVIQWTMGDDRSAEQVADAFNLAVDGIAKDRRESAAEEKPAPATQGGAPSGLKTPDDQELTSEAAHKAVAIGNLLVSKYGFTMTARNDNVWKRTFNTRYTRTLVDVGVDPSYPDSVEINHEFPVYITNQSADSAETIADAIAKADYADYAQAITDDGEISPTITDEGSYFYGKSLEFARAAQSIVEEGASGVGARVNYGDFNNSLSQGLMLDSAESAVYGVTAQLHSVGRIWARAEISEQGRVTLYKGAAGSEVAGTPESAKEVSDILSALIDAWGNEQKAQAAKKLPVPTGNPALPADAGDYLKSAYKDAEQYQQELIASGNPYLSMQEFQAGVNSGNRAGYKLADMQTRLQEYKNDLQGVQAGTVKPAKIIGRGGKKAGAIQWLNEQIKELEIGIASGGIFQQTNMRNYASTLRDLIRTGQDTGFTSNEELQAQRAADEKSRAQAEQQEAEKQAKFEASREYEVGSTDGMRSPMELNYSVPNDRRQVVLDLAAATTAHERYEILSKAGISQVGETQFNKAVELNSALKKGAKFGYFSIAKRAGYSLVKLVIDLAAGEPAQPMEPQMQPAPQPEPQANPDRDLLQGLIDGSVDARTVDLDQLEAIYTRNADNAEIVALFEKAVDVVEQAELAATETV